MAQQYDPKTQEPEVLEFWKKEKIYQKANVKNKGQKKFYFLDGPPYTSGKVHLGTAWNKTLKDVILRYKRMAGFDVWDRAGYDMHGLPTENATEKKLGLKGKADIQKFGVDKFVRACEQLSVENMKVMNEDFQRLGVWMDFDNAYQSIKKEFVEGVWWLIKRAHENGRLYQGLRTMHWSAANATSLAKHELEYETVEDDSIFLKFRLKDEKDTFLLVWTTTPWTIPYNMAVMANPEIEYVKAQVGKEKWILAKPLAAVVIQGVADKTYKVLDTFKGDKLEGVAYEHPLKEDIPFFKESKNNPKLHTVVLSEEYVDTSAGTGLVHCAPGCGPEDYEVGHRNGLPPFNTLDERGVVENLGRFTGLRARTDDKEFIKALEEKGVLIATTKVEHEYPFDQRSHEPVVFRTTKQWFFKVEDLKEQMLKENSKIHWVPKTAFNAFNAWLSNLRDNSVSKQRYWGTPLPIWLHEESGEIIVVESVSELGKLSKQKVKDVHLPWIDEITIEKDGKVFKRVPDVLDVWVDAGTVSWNCLDYPKEKAAFKKLFPADFILEGKDQIRGWFNLLMVASMVAMQRPSFKAVYMHGFVQDAQGRKMSKSLGNYILPQEVVGKHGADTFRFYCIGGTNAGLDLNYNPEDVQLKSKNLLVLWNLHRYVLEMAKQLKANPAALKISAPELEERYILSRLHTAIKKVTYQFDHYLLDQVPSQLESLFLELSRTYVQLVREKASIGEDKEKKLVLATLHTVLLETLTLFAPIAPFITEIIYQNLKEAFSLKEESIHLRDWPKVTEKKIDEKLEQQMEAAQRVMQSILSGREKMQLGVRWPLKEAVLVIEDEAAVKAVEALSHLIKLQTNVKELRFEKSEPTGDFEKVELQKGFAYLNKERTPELEAEGFAREIMRRIQALRKKNGFQKSDKINLAIQTDVDLEAWKSAIAEKVNACSITISDKKAESERPFSSKEKIKGKEFDVQFDKA